MQIYSAIMEDERNDRVMYKAHWRIKLHMQQLAVWLVLACMIFPCVVPAGAAEPDCIPIPSEKELVWQTQSVPPVDTEVPAEQHIFSTQTPDDFGLEGMGAHLNLGIKFQTKRPGSVIGARIYTNEEEFGPHIVTIWDVFTGEAVAGPYEWMLDAGIAGWREYKLPEPAALEAEHPYILSVSNHESYLYYARGFAEDCNLANSITSCDLVTFPSSGVYGPPGTMPTMSFQNCNYFRDVVFVPDEPFSVELERIAITNPPQKTVYLEGEPFNAAGMEVTAYYTDNSIRILSPDEYIVTPAQALTASDQQITVSYEENTAQVDIFVTKEVMDPATLVLDVTETRFGARADGETDDRAAIQRAIDFAAAVGGGVVTLPGEGGTAEEPVAYLSGNLFLKSNVELRIECGAELRQSADVDDYVRLVKGNYISERPYLGHDYASDVPWNHAHFHNYPFIYAGARIEQEPHNIKITGGGSIRMSWEGDCPSTIHAGPIGFYRVNRFEISDITIHEFTTYAIMPFHCTNGLISHVELAPDWHSDYTGFNTDGISMQNCQNIRVTGCKSNTGDDGFYVWSSYQDPRGGAFTWWDSEHPQPSRNIEIDHNEIISVPEGPEGKAVGLISWGSSCPDLRNVEISNIYVHDNTLNRVGIWYDDPFDARSGPAPIKNIRFENNDILEIQANYQYGNISDLYFDESSRGDHVLLRSMAQMCNGDFEVTGDLYWIAEGDAGASTELCGQEGAWFGYLDGLDQEGPEGDSRLYQGLYLVASSPYHLSARVQSDGGLCRIFVRDQISDELVAEQCFSNTEWEEIALDFTVPQSGNYRVGLERVDANGKYARMDTVNLELIRKFEGDWNAQTLLADRVPSAVVTSDPNPYEMGVSFYATHAGLMTAARLYATAEEAGIHTVRVWETGSRKLLAGPYEWEIISNGRAEWKTFSFPEPLTLEPNIQYTVSISASGDGCFASDNTQLEFAVQNGYLHMVDMNGLPTCFGVINYGYGQMPVSEYGANYFRDLVFVPTYTLDVIGGTGTGVYQAGTQVTVTAVSNDERLFLGWEAEGMTLADTEKLQETLTFELTADVSLRAVFEQPVVSAASPQYTIVVEPARNGTVKSSRNRAPNRSIITLSVTPDEGYALASLTVSDGMGDALELRTTGENRFAFRMGDANVVVKASFAVEGGMQATTAFMDVSTGDWYADAVEYVAELGLMRGTSQTAFSPGGATTRGMIVTILHRQAGSPAAESDGAAWWSDARVWAMENGVSDGTDMEALITREQLAAMLYRYAKLEGRDVSGTTALDSFQDSAAVSAYAVDALQWAVGSGIVTGRPGGLLDPKAGATRAETAAMFMRYR